MELPACKDIGGEEPHDSGFCPVDYFIPTYIGLEIVSETISSSGKIERDISNRRTNNPQGLVLSEFSTKNEFTNGITGEQCVNIIKQRPLTPLTYYQFGFVAGCIWGDDSSWKIQYLDLSEAEKGILKREERFGYIILPENQTLKNAIEMYDHRVGDEDYSNQIQINTIQTFDATTGKVIHPFD